MPSGTCVQQTLKCDKLQLTILVQGERWKHGGPGAMLPTPPDVQPRALGEHLCSCDACLWLCLVVKLGIFKD